MSRSLPNRARALRGQPSDVAGPAIRPVFTGLDRGVAVTPPRAADGAITDGKPYPLQPRWGAACARGPRELGAAVGQPATRSASLLRLSSEVPGNPCWDRSSRSIRRKSEEPPRRYRDVTRPDKEPGTFSARTACPSGSPHRLQRTGVSLPPPLATCRGQRSSLCLPSPLAGKKGLPTASSQHLQRTEVFRAPQRGVFLKNRTSKSRRRPVWAASGEGRWQEGLCPLQVARGGAR